MTFPVPSSSARRTGAVVVSRRRSKPGLVDLLNLKQGTLDEIFGCNVLRLGDISQIGGNDNKSSIQGGRVELDERGAAARSYSQKM